ncbi:MAG TPA: small, acid-soluble spore protein, alpha/beta type [Hydrogenispora sp.]|nr:small, acid-soluble spore protein, alpha/beta type [Hydrogenispora sp.]
MSTWIQRNTFKPALPVFFDVIIQRNDFLRRVWISYERRNSRTCPEKRGGGKVAKRKRPANKRKSELENLKWEVADLFDLDDDLAQGGDELTVREAGKIGGNMVKKLVEKGKEALRQEQKDPEQ